MATPGENLTKEMALRATVDLVRKVMPVHHHVDHTHDVDHAPSMSVAALPITAAPDAWGPARHVTDVVEDIPGPVGKMLRDFAKDRRLGEAVAPYSLAEPFAGKYRMSIFLLPLRAYQNWVMDTTVPGDAFSLGWWTVD